MDNKIYNRQQTYDGVFNIGVIIKAIYDLQFCNDVLFLFD